MPSLIQGYEYDIFISYRQKDNKGERWVSEFVEALKTELESTFKEEISVYFDINPHDGLLETHDVDESLKEKLKCLIFIPIISRTYCDPKAFAWEHEFKAFVEQASNDVFGLKVKLSNGNVASRVLPVVIHDLDVADARECELVLGGVMRGVEFIYKEPGVNKPLTADDNENKNLNGTKYRIQVNKVANATRDVLIGLTKRKIAVGDTISDNTPAEKESLKVNTYLEKQQKVLFPYLLNSLKNLVYFIKRTWRQIIWSLILLIVGFGVCWLILKKSEHPSERAVIRYDIALENDLGHFGRNAMAISPDGEYLVYVMNGELNLINLRSDTTSIPIEGTTSANVPFFSPDGQWIGFENVSEAKLMKVSLAGGNPIALCVMGGIQGGNWCENEIIVGVGNAIYHIPESGGTPEKLYPLANAENTQTIWNPQLLPDKKTLLFSQQRDDGDWSIMAWRMGSNENPVVLVEKGRNGRFLSSEYIAYTFNNHLYVAQLNLRALRIEDEPIIIETNQVFENLIPRMGTSLFDISENGILVYYEQRETGRQNIVWIEENSKETISITKESKAYGTAVISSDEQNIAAQVFNQDEQDYQIEIINTKTGYNQIFAENAVNPIWSADNSSLVYVSSSTGNQVFQKPLNLSAPARLLFEIDSASSLQLNNLSADGRYLPFGVDFGNRNDMGYYDMAEDKIEMLNHYNTDWDDNHPVISPDGKWLAYSSDYDRQYAIYVTPFPGPGQAIRITPARPANDIMYPAWATDMTALFYTTISPNYEIWKVKIDPTDKEFLYESPQSVFKSETNSFYPFNNLEIGHDSHRFIGYQWDIPANQQLTERIKVVVNWEQELEEN